MRFPCTLKRRVDVFAAFERDPWLRFGAACHFRRQLHSGGLVGEQRRRDEIENGRATLLQGFRREGIYREKLPRHRCYNKVVNNHPGNRGRELHGIHVAKFSAGNALLQHRNQAHGDWPDVSLHDARQV